MEVALQRDQERGRPLQSGGVKVWHIGKNKCDDIELFSQAASVTASESSDHSEPTNSDSVSFQCMFQSSSSPLPSPRLSVPLLRVALSASTSGRGASAISRAAGASDADGGPALALQRHPYVQARALRPIR